MHKNHFGINMNGNIIQLTNDKVTLIDKAPRNKGMAIILNIDLPEGAILKSFPLNVTVSECEKIRINETDCYLLEMKIGELSKENRQILQGYLEYINRDHLTNLIDDNVEFSTILETVQH